ncbi:MAG: DNA repair protein RadC [Ruminococcaceae bacterium]|nr:DNA repair protein RadC [Oscillospiraceae bacterium]
MGLHDGHRQRKKEQFLQHGLDGFADHEVLELLLYYAIPRRDTNEIAHRLVNAFGSLGGVFGASVEELSRVEGVGEQTALFLTLLPAAGQYAALEGRKEIILNSVESVGRFFLQLLRGERREVLYQVCLDAKGKLLSYGRLSSGTTSMAPVSVREVVETALRCDASRVVLGHNHPSGVALPSEEDRQVTAQIRQALQTVSIDLVDHIVVADEDFVSMAASGMLL